MKKIKEEKGSISAVVLVTILFFIIVLSVVYTTHSVLRQAQLKSEISLKEVYEKDLNNIDDVYKQAIMKTWEESVKEVKNGVPIPKGYYYVGGTKDTGLVISDSSSDENAINFKGSDGLKGNQWVWVPVEDVSKIYESANPEIEITGGIGNTYLSGVTVSKYSKTGIISGNFGTRGLPNDTTNYREPDIVIESTGDKFDALNYTILGFSSLKNMAQTMVNDYNTMIESIAKYGGFYIGRYELASNGEKTGAAVTNSSWYILYAKCKELAASNAVQTRMIWGCQWDITCDWISNTNTDKSITDSKSWGNYRDSISPANTGNYESGVKKDTGLNEAWKANNIYDFAGNCLEWTQEAFSSSNRAARGGYYWANGSDGPAIYRNYGSPTYDENDAIRFSSDINNKIA